MLKRVRESGTETAMDNDLRPRLAVPIFCPRLFLLLLFWVVIMLGSSSLEQCLRFWEAMEVFVELVR